MKLRRYWKNLSVSKNIYRIVGILAVVMMAIEFFTFRIAVVGEKKWVPLLLWGAFIVEGSGLFFFVGLVRKMSLSFGEQKVRLHTTKQKRQQAETSTRIKSLFLAWLSQLADISFWNLFISFVNE